MENGESVDQKELTAEELKNLAWNAFDAQNEALVKLEYFLIAHHGHLTNYFNEIDGNNTSQELFGFWLISEEILKGLKESSETIFEGFKVCRK